MRIVVIGAGAAGLMAGVFAAREGAEVRVLDHNEKAGKKIYITGKGRGNVTNNCETDEFLREVPRNPRFLYSALNFFGPKDMMAFMENEGIPVVTQRGRRVFPASEKASDITKALLSALKKAGGRVETGKDVLRVLTGEDGAVKGVMLRSGEEIPADRVIIATGGRSYSATGSTGDGYRMAKETGHRVKEILPSLIPVESPDEWPKKLQGLGLKNVRLTLKDAKGKTLYTELGEMLMTHFGFSGPLILEASCHLPEDMAGCEWVLDLKPGMTEEQVDARLRREMEAGGKKKVRTMMGALLPSSFAEVFPGICGVDGEMECNQVKGAQRAALVAGLKRLKLNVSGRRPIEEAIVTRGGVDVRDIRPQSMESKVVEGLYFAGEVLDVDCHTGGYNLQTAFSTGALAGHSAANE